MFTSIAIVGAGAIGCYYGARLALAGSDVKFLMRRDRDHVREHGLTLRERDGTRRLERVQVHADAHSIGPVDLVVVTLKTTANSLLAEVLPPLLGPRTAVLTLQNGLGSEELIAGIAGGERVLGGLCFIAVTREGAGELVGYHTPGLITLGEHGRPPGERAEAIAALLRGAGVRVRVARRLEEARWQKLIWNVPFNGLAIAAGGIPTDRILATPEHAARVRPLMDELAEAGRRFGFEISPEFIQGQIDVTPPMGAYKPSSLVDYLAGREVEVEAIWGEPLRRARAAGIEMPRLAALYEELKRLTNRAAG